MKNFASLVALSLFNVGIISAQNQTITPIISIDGASIEIQLQNSDNSVATDRDILVKDRRKKTDFA